MYVCMVCLYMYVFIYTHICTFFFLMYIYILAYIYTRYVYIYLYLYPFVFFHFFFLKTRFDFTSSWCTSFTHIFTHHWFLSCFLFLRQDFDRSDSNRHRVPSLWNCTAFDNGLICFGWPWRLGNGSGLYIFCSWCLQQKSFPMRWVLLRPSVHVRKLSDWDVNVCGVLMYIISLYVQWKMNRGERQI